MACSWCQCEEPCPRGDTKSGFHPVMGNLISDSCSEIDRVTQGEQKHITSFPKEKHYVIKNQPFDSAVTSVRNPTNSLILSFSFRKWIWLLPQRNSAGNQSRLHVSAWAPRHLPSPPPGPRCPSPPSGNPHLGPHPYSWGLLTAVRVPGAVSRDPHAHAWCLSHRKLQLGNPGTERACAPSRGRPRRSSPC